MPKLHIPGPGSQATACGRQLNNHRSARAQDAANAVTATSLQEYLDALAKGQACRHCGREAGIIPRIVRSQRDDVDEDSDCED